MTDSRRKAKERARYLDATTELDYRKALALAYSEQGCSHNGIAQNIGSTKSTVTSYIDEIADRYGSDVVVSVGVPEKKDITPLSEQPAKGPTTRVKQGQKVVVSGDCPGPHTVERFFRTWTREGRIHRDEKIALSLKSYDERAQNRLGALEWDEHHCTYDPQYNFASAPERGAWTFDNDIETVLKVREVAHVPPVDRIPVIAETTPRREDVDPFLCVNTECDSDRAHSARDLDAYPRLDGSGVEVTQKSEVVSHICLSCRSLFEPVPVGVVNETSECDSDNSGSDGVLVEAMQ
jgi:transposase